MRENSYRFTTGNSLIKDFFSTKVHNNNIYIVLFFEITQKCCVLPHTNKMFANTHTHIYIYNV